MHEYQHRAQLAQVALVAVLEAVEPFRVNQPTGQQSAHRTGGRGTLHRFELASGPSSASESLTGMLNTNEWQRRNDHT